MTEKYIELNLNDKRAGKVAQIIGNKTAKKILNLLADEELSQGDIAKSLKIGPSNVDYNIKNLIGAGLIEKSSSFFWSVKGKKIPTYKIANKKIIISTKNSFKSLVFSGIFWALIFGIFKFGTNYFSIPSGVASNAARDFSSEATYATAPVLAKAYDVQISCLWCGVLGYTVMGLIIGLLAYFLFKFLKGGFNKL